MQSQPAKRNSISKEPVESRQPVMATIHDDDERLLARIGYKQVHQITHQIHGVLRVLTHIRNFAASLPNGRQSPMPFQSSEYSARSLLLLGYQSAWVVPRRQYGRGSLALAWLWSSQVQVQIQLSNLIAFADGVSRRAGLCLSHGRRHLLRHQACGAAGARRHLGLDHRLVQLLGPSYWCCLAGVHNRADDTRRRKYELGLCRWELRLCTVRNSVPDDAVMQWADLACSTALQTVLVAILTLCVFGIICSLTTKALHRIVLWFAPINGEIPASG